MMRILFGTTSCELSIIRFMIRYDPRSCHKSLIHFLVFVCLNLDVLIMRGLYLISSVLNTAGCTPIVF